MFLLDGVLETKVPLQRDVPLDDELISSLANYDMLVVPGGPARPGQPVALQVAELSGPFMTLISEFAELPKSEGQFPRILLSVHLHDSLHTVAKLE